MKEPVAIIFANLKGNIGDFAILEAMIRDLRNRYPDREVHVFAHGHLAEDRERLDAFVKAAPKGFVVAGKTNEMHVSPFLKVFSLIGLWTVVQRHAVKNIGNRWAREAKKFADYHAVFLAGGQQWSGRRVGMSMAAMTKAISLHNPRIYAYPFGLNPEFVDYTSPAALRETLSLVKSPLVVRDGLSSGLIEQLRLRVVLGADCVFSLQDPAADIPARSDRNPERLIVALTGGPTAHLVKALRPALTRIVGGARPVELLTTCAVTDGAAFEQLANEFGIPFRAPLTWQDVVAELRTASALISNRLHALIFGMFAGVPLIPVTDRKKLESFANDAAMPYFAADIGDVNEDLIDVALANRPLIIERARAYAAASRQRALGPIID